MQQDNASPGTVEGTELIARGAYAPSHGDAKKLKITNQLIKFEELAAGTASVYRLSSVGLTPQQAADVLVKARSDATLFAVTATPAEKIRAIPYKGGARAFCVVDECESDGEGNKHPAHAHIAICRSIPEDEIVKDSDEMRQIFRDLLNLLKPKTSIVWPDQKLAA